MATVRITDQIRSDVRRKVESLFDSLIQKKYGELQNLDVAMQVFLTRVSPAALEKAKALNEDCEWVPTISNMDVRISYLSFNGITRDRTFTVPFKPPVPAPTSFQGYLARSHENIVCPTMACYQPCVDVLTEYDRLTHERNTLRDSLHSLLCECSTLRQVLERWPTALDFMSDEVKARHAERSDSKTKKVIAEVDDSTKMLLMKARMMNGV